MGAAGADLWMQRWESYYAARPWAYAFEGPNEPSIWEFSVLAGFPAFHQRFIQRMHDKGRKVVVGNINVGWPNYDQIDEIGAGIQGADFLGLHEYGHREGMWYEPDQTWLCLRYRRTAQWLGELGYSVPDILITECGIDEVVNGTHVAWKTVPLTADQYVEQLVWYEQELRKDDFVKGAFIFTGTPNGDWMQFEVTEELAMKLAGELQNLPAPPPPVERARGFMATKYQTTLNWDLIAREYDYVMMRISGPNVPSGYTHLETDPYLIEHTAGAEHFGIPKGGFHFLVPDLDGQAGFFAKAAAPYCWELPLFCDVEAAGLTRDRVDQFLVAADKRLPENHVEYPDLGIYTNLNLWGKLGPWDRTLWLAQWGVAEPSMSGWKFWQYGGGPIPEGEYTSLDLYKSTVYDLKKDYGLEEQEESSMVEVIDLNGNVIEGGWADAEARGARIISASPPDGASVWRVKRLILDTGGSMAFRCYAKNALGQPLPEIAILMGWDSNDATDLPDDAAPRLSDVLGFAQPEGKPNTALILPDPFTGVDGFLEWSWGPGEFIDPDNPAHWCWVMCHSGDAGDPWYTDVIFVPGWWDEHIKYWVVFELEVADDGGQEPIPEDDVLAALNRLIVVSEAVARHLGVEL